MGFFDGLFGMKNKIPKIISILPLAAKQEIQAGRLPVLNTDKLFLKQGNQFRNQNGEAVSACGAQYAGIIER